MTAGAATFRPTRQQEAFRALARAAYDDNRRNVADWCRASRLEDSEHPVSIARFQSWEEEPGFVAWWAEEFPESGGQTATDQRLLAHRFWDSLGKGLDAREGWAAQTYGRLLAIRQIASSVSDPVLQAWLDGERGAAWATGAVGDAK